MRRLAAGLTIAALAWVALLVATPYALRHPAGSVPASVLYAAASRICHQRPERSFHLSGVQLPVCARCFGLYAAAAFGAAAAWSTRRPGRRDARPLLAVAAIPTAVTWGAEAVGLAGFSNVVRAGAALPLGAAAGWVIVSLLRYDAQRDGHEIYRRGARALDG